MAIRITRFKNSLSDFKFMQICSDGVQRRMIIDENVKDWLKASNPTDSEFTANLNTKNRDLMFADEDEELKYKQLKLKVIGKVEYPKGKFSLDFFANNKGPTKIDVPITVYVAEDTKLAKDQDESVTPSQVKDYVDSMAGINDKFDAEDYFATFCIAMESKDSKDFESGKPVKAINIDGWNNLSIFAKLSK